VETGLQAFAVRLGRENNGHISCAQRGSDEAAQAIQQKRVLRVKLHGMTGVVVAGNLADG
jgi:hypothetical protein